MKIKIGDLELNEKYKGIHGTDIILLKDGKEIARVDSLELKLAIEVLEKTCWRDPNLYKGGEICLTKSLKKP